MSVQKFLISGGPGSGKTSVINALRETFPNEILIVPEAATILLQGGFPPPGEKPHLTLLTAFQRAIFHLIVELENAYIHKAQEEGCPLIVCDRGRLDGEAYAGGWEAFTSMVGNLNRNEQLQTYDHAIFLESLATHDLLLWNREAGNTMRMENDPIIAAAMDKRHWEAWKDHPTIEYISCENGIEGKITRAEAIVREILSLYLSL